MNSSRCLMRNMVKTMNDFSELLKQDSETVHEYDDERLVSTLRYTSLSHSLREEPNSEDFKNDNQWLFKENDEFGNIRVINFDRIPEMCNCSGVNTCDAFFYDYNGTSRSYLIEFKNCSRDELQRKYLKTDSSDSILKKVIGSRNILCSELNFEGKYTSSDLISNTHVIIVYNGKKTVPSRKIPLSSISKQKSDGRRPANVNFRKSEEEITDKTGIEIKKAGFSECYKNDFPVPGKPEFVKNKCKGSVRNYTLFSDTDFREVIEEQFFSNWDWGEYSDYFRT